MKRNIGILFDLDGVLIDSESIYTDFWNMIEKTYPTNVPNFAIVIKGSNISTILNTYFPNKKVQESIIKTLEEFEAKMEYAIFPGVIELLEQIKQADIPMAVVTSSDKTKVNKLFTQHPHFKSYFHGIVTGDMVKESKPAPECFLKGAEILGVDTDKCIVFEDSVSGVQAGLSSGAKVIALTTTLPNEIIKTKANKIIDSFINLSLNDILI